MTLVSGLYLLFSVLFEFPLRHVVLLRGTAAAGRAAQSPISINQIWNWR